MEASALILSHKTSIYSLFAMEKPEAVIKYQMTNSEYRKNYQVIKPKTFFWLLDIGIFFGILVWKLGILRLVCF